MKRVRGSGVFAGIAIGPLHVYRRAVFDTAPHPVADTAAELALFEQARSAASERLKTLHDHALHTVGEEEAAIFDVHGMMLNDLDFTESITGMIAKGLPVACAVARTVDNLADMFAGMDDAYMQARAADVRDVGHRLLSVLHGVDDDIALAAGIVAADDLAPSETVRLDMSRVIGFATTGGSATGHSAILARTRGIPAVIGLGRAFSAASNGVMAILDGETGEVILNPDASTLAAARARQASHADHLARLNTLKGQASVSRSGTRMKIVANIGNPGDVTAVLNNDAEGIGLFRSEFLYLEKTAYPTEDELFEVYRTVAQALAGRQVIIRTLDMGADKQADYFQMDKEENPALGCRAVRLCLARPALFRTQLRAICRAAAFGNLAIMVPMIVSVDEVRAVRKLLDNVRTELNMPELPVIPFGIMIETPAAALISDDLAREVDFFSIGTNDLTQYTLAVDRQNHKLAALYDAKHPAVLRLIHMVVDNAHAAGIWAGICGDLAADRSMTQTFLQMGVDELSVAPSLVLPLREQVIQSE